VASYALSEVDSYGNPVEDAKMVACAAISAEVAGLPVCAATEFLLSFIDSHSDWSQNSPSSQAGEWHAALDDRGLGGNINTVALQFYDPFNLPSVTIYESSGCTGSSTTFGIRNYTFFGGSENP